MRITLALGPFMPVPPVLGGAVEKVHLLLAGVYRAAGHEVTVVSRRYKDFAHEEIVDGIRHIRVASFDRSSSLPANLLRDFRYALHVAHSLPQSDITVTNSFALPLVLPRTRAGRIYVQVGRFPKHQMFLYSGADRLQAVSTAVAEAIARQAPWLKRKLTVIGYAISDAYFHAPAPRPPTVLFVGRIAREKGIELPIEACIALAAERASTLPGDWTLRIVGPHDIVQGGDGPAYLDELKALAAPLGPRCQFVGPVFDQEALIREYRRAAIFVYPSLAEKGESFGLAPLEAMAAGCAAVVSNLRCFDDFIEHDVSGLKFDHRGHDAARGLAAQLARLLGEPALLQKIADAGHRSAHRFQASAIGARMLDDFASLLADHAAQPGSSPPRQR